MADYATTKSQMARREFRARSLKENAEQKVKTFQRYFAKELLTQASDSNARKAAKLGLGRLRYNASVSYMPRVIAYTDFSQIVVDWPEDNVPSFLRKQKVKDTLVSMTGVFEHELGHNRFTVPFCDLRLDATFQQTWNMLEDQRMETNLVRKDPHLENVMTHMVCEVVLNGEVPGASSWLLVARRDYLPDDIRTAAYKECADTHGEEAAEEWFKAATRYLKADTTYELGSAVEAAEEVLRKYQMVTPPVPSMQHYTGESPNADSQEVAEQSAIKGSAALPPESEDEDLHVKDVARQHKLDPSAVGNDVLESTINRARNAAEKRQEKDAKAVGGSVEWGDGGGVDRPMDSKEITDSMEVAGIIKEAMASFVTKNNPRWVDGQETGFIDPLRYRTREVGALNYRRNLEGEMLDGLGVHVTILGDVSGSMTGDDVVALSTFLRGANLALTELGVGHDAGLFNDAHVTTIHQDDFGDHVYRASGGTDPSGTLETLDQVYDASAESNHHLVLVFTDGYWSAPTSLERWNEPNRSFVVINYKEQQEGRRTDRHVVPKKGANAEVTITDMLDLTYELQLALADVVRTQVGR